MSSDILLTPKPLEWGKAVQRPLHLSCGAVVLFTGHGRGLKGEKPISAVCSEAYRQMAQEEVRKAAGEVRERFGARRD